MENVMEELKQKETCDIKNCLTDVYENVNGVNLCKTHMTKIRSGLLANVEEENEKKEKVKEEIKPENKTESKPENKTESKPENKPEIKLCQFKTKTGSDCKRKAIQVPMKNGMYGCHMHNIDSHCENIYGAVNKRRCTGGGKFSYKGKTYCKSCYENIKDMDELREFLERQQRPENPGYAPPPKPGGKHNRENDLRILGLSEKASLQDIKTAFKKLALEFHPDKNPEGETRYKEIVNAYERLIPGMNN
jgi:hypothetical protein